DRRARMLNFILLSTLLMWTVLGIAVRILHADHSQPLLMIGAIMAWELVMLVLMRAGRVGLACYLLTFGLGAFMLISTFLFGGVRQVSYSAYMLVILTGGLLLGRRVVVTLASTGVAGGLLILIAETRNLLPPYDPAGAPVAWAAVSISFIWASLVIYFALRSADDAIEQANKGLTERNDAEKRLEHYTERLEVLREMDQAILAAQSPGAIAQASIAHIRRLIPCQRASVTLFNFESEEAIVLASNLDGSTRLGEGMRLSFEAFFSLPELLKGRDCLIADLAAIPDGSFSKQQLMAEGMRSILNVPLNSRGELIGSLNLGHTSPNAFDAGHVEVAQELANSLAVALQNARLLQESQHQAQELAGLYETSLAITSVLETGALLERLYKQVEQMLSPDTFVAVLCNPGDQDVRVALVVEEDERLHEYDNMRLPLEDGGLTGWVLSNRSVLLVGDMERDPLPVQPKHGSRPARAWLGVPLIARDQLVGAISVQSFQPHAFDDHHQRFLESLAAQVAITVENARLFEAERQRSKEMAAVSLVSSALRNVQTRAEMLPIILDQVLKLMDAQGAAIAVHDPLGENLVVEFASGIWAHWKGKAIGLEEAVFGQVLVDSQPCFRSAASSEHDQLASSPGNEPAPSASVPLIAQDRTIGMLYIGRQKAVSTDEIKLLTAIADIAASAIQRATFHEQTTHRLQQVQALHAIDQAITSSVDLRLTLKTVLEQVMSQLQVDAAGILLLDQSARVLEFAARLGFNTGALRHTHLNIGESYAGRAALERRIIHIPDLSEKPGDFSRAVLLAGEGFVTYYAVPLVAKGQVKGVLELFQRASFEPDPDWQDFLESLATQAAIAIDNAQLFADLQRSNQELALAYDTTLEGWSRALELRDQETEGHTSRVTDLTLRLSRTMGMSEAELVQVRRGALLHDIGKMGIPDSILLKDSPLSAEEWAVMRRHPIYAHELLSPVPFLKSALDIPYCHHEKWDGSGYPQGLIGEQIPLAARIFAIVDVWDALNSDRPYRPAWPKDKAVRYIRSQAGTHFDPRIVDVFLGTIQEELR
ncbi:MAG TPA: GAF domain-containing protein, partial [Anaerolineales bacterium]|nr:GAF domain-containing protein [Anaerolineales bacterium]